jgi:hypothetical protein
MTAFCRFQPCPTCCAPLPCNCTDLTNCPSNLFPSTASVTLSGITNSTCTACNTFNTTFYLTCEGNKWGGCTFRYTFDTAVCTVKYIDMTIYGDGGRNWAQVVSRTATNAAVFVFEKMFSPQHNCRTFSSESLIPQPDATQCNISSATCLLTTT